MVRFTVLASGSKGNSALVTHCPGDQEDSSECTRILVDAGLSCRELFRRMRLVGEDPARLDAILVTHEHQDHIDGLAVTARKLGIPVYFTEATHRAWVRQRTPQRRVRYADWAEEYRRQKLAGAEVGLAAARMAEGASDASADKDAKDARADKDAECFRDASAKENAEDAGADKDAEGFRDASAKENAKETSAGKGADGDCRLPARLAAELPRVEYFRAGEAFAIGGVRVSPFTIPHDAADPVGFVFTVDGVRLAIATDLGYMPPNIQAQLRRCDLIMIESNHDLEMLRDGPYPWSVKQRVLSRVGHLSNDAAAAYLEDSYDGAATYVILAHLSESNNLPELARIAAERALVAKPSLLANRLLLACQNEPLDAVCF